MVVKQQYPELYKIPPQALEIEEAVIGALIVDSSSFDQIRMILKKEMFYSSNNALIYEVIQNRHNQSKIVDLMVLTIELRERGTLDQIGGALHLTQLTNKIIGSFDIEKHAHILVEKYAKREMIKFCFEMIAKTYDESNDICEIIADYNQGLKTIDDNFAIADTGINQIDVIKSTLENIYEGIEKRSKGLDQGITTGFRELNRSTGGWRETNFVILAARPGVGKTSVALAFAKAAAKKDQYVNFFSYEMTEIQLEKILITGETEISRSSIRDSNLSENDLIEINKAAGRIENLPIIWNTKNLNIEQLEAIVKQNIKKGKCNLVIIDYIQLIKPTDTKTNREQQISHISRSLKMIATTYKIPVIALSQLNREIEKRASKKPVLSDLRESGSMEQDADTVIFPFKEDNGDYFLSVAKQRNGRVGDIQIFANEEMTKITDLNTYHFEPSSQIEMNISTGLTPNEVPF